MEHTEAMLTAWQRLGVDLADLAVRRRDGAMLWQRGRVLEALPLAWARAENAHGADIYVRPARGHAWALVFLDDVAPDLALEVAGSNGGLAVRTSPEGGCHLWLPISGPLDEEGRCRRQKWLAQQLEADPASTSGEHLGRLAGFRNWKRGGCWVNILTAMTVEAHQSRVEDTGARLTRVERQEVASGRDRSLSGQEWGWACRMLESGSDPQRVYEALVEKAAGRRGADAERYARRTVERATEKVARQTR
jgi:hypothetical protein